MSMTFRHLILGFSLLFVLPSCTGDRYYDTEPYGQYGRPPGRAGRAPSPYGGQAAPYGTQAAPYGTQGQAPYGSQPGSVYGGTAPGHSPYAPGAPSAGPGAQGATNPSPALPPPNSPAAAAKTYPVARPSGKPGVVISPYDPNKLIDVSGFPSGKRVKDRDTGEIFIVP